jgi:hypothetical protein
MNAQTIRENLSLARQIAEQDAGTTPSPEIVAAVLNAITAQGLNDQLKIMTSDLCRAAAVAAGN